MAFQTKKKPTTQENTVKRKGKVTRRHIVNSICIVFLSTILITSIVGFVVLQNILNKSEILSGIDGLTSDNSSRIFDANGKLITSVAGESGVRENIKYDQIPQVVVDAFLSVEDSRFFKHNGFDLPRFMKSGLVNVTSGGIRQGGSTLTMQLVDVALFPEDAVLTSTTTQKIEQKVQEIFKSMEIEEELPKDKIIENYLNKINFGGPARGIQKGAEYYFGKKVEDLNLSEAAFLAGVINAPASNNPYYGVETDAAGNVTVNYYNEAVSRRNTALNLMNQHGYISNSELELAKSTKLSFDLNGETTFETDKYASLIQYVKDEANNTYGINIDTSAVDVYTSFDLETQNYANAIDDGTAVDYAGVPFDVVNQYDGRFNFGASLINNQNGEVIAFCDGWGGNPKGNEQSYRSNTITHEIGSTSKMIIDYPEAFDELGYATTHVLEDGPTPYAGNIMYNASRDKGFQGDVTLENAISNSLNVPAFKTYVALRDAIGVDGIKEYLRKNGIPDEVIDQLDDTYSIGGSNFRLNPLQLASSYQALANGGERFTTHSIRTLDFQDDNKKDIEANYTPQRVYSEGAAWLSSYMLEQAVKGGAGALEDFQAPYKIYGKTGTTDFDKKEAARLGYPEVSGKDSWTVGYTSNFTAATWAGYDEHLPEYADYQDLTKLYTWDLHGRVTRSLLEKATQNGTIGADPIPMSDEVTSISHISGLFPYATAPANQSDLMVKGYILKKFAGNLKTVEPDPLDNPTKFDASFSDGVLSYALSEYPDKEKLTEASKTKTMSANGVTAPNGRRIFDKSFLFGAVKYKLDITVNGTSIGVQTLASPIGTFNTWPTPLKNGDKVKACGFYAYDKIDVSSSRLCSEEFTVDNVIDDMIIPADFDNLFNEGQTFTDTMTKVHDYMVTYFPSVADNIKYYTNPNLPKGTLDPTSDLYSGLTLQPDMDYKVIIGNKE